MALFGIRLSLRPPTAMTSKGKIAASIPNRDELNRPIDDGEPGTVLVQWLNANSEMQRVQVFKASA